jgi:hypothetical protein
MIFQYNLLTASSPRERCGETFDEIEEGPRDDDAVVNIQEKNDSHRGVANTCDEKKISLVILSFHH